MAIPHIDVAPISRSKGKSMIAKSAYNTGSKLHELDGRLQAYDRKGGVRFKKLYFAPEFLGCQETRQDFWQAVELSEKRKDACTGREFQSALPCELTYEQNKSLTQEFADFILDRYGFKAIDIAIHYPTKFRPNASRHENPHIHILTPDRDAKGKKINLSRNPDEILYIRDVWEKIINRHLEAAGSATRISTKRLTAQIEEHEKNIAALTQQKSEIEAALIAVQQEIAHEREQEARPPASQDARGRSASQTVTNEPRQQAAQEPEPSPPITERGNDPSPGSDKPSARQAGRASQQGRSPDIRPDTGRPPAAAREDMRPRRENRILTIAKKIASRIDAVRYQRQLWAQKHRIHILAHKIANRIDGARYVRSITASNILTGTTARAEEETQHPSGPR